MTESNYLDVVTKDGIQELTAIVLVLIILILMGIIITFFLSHFKLGTRLAQVETKLGHVESELHSVRSDFRADKTQIIIFRFTVRF